MDGAISFLPAGFFFHENVILVREEVVFIFHCHPGCPVNFHFLYVGSLKIPLINYYHNAPEMMID